MSSEKLPQQWSPAPYLPAPPPGGYYNYPTSSAGAQPTISTIPSRYVYNPVWSSPQPQQQLGGYYTQSPPFAQELPSYQSHPYNPQQNQSQDPPLYYAAPPMQQYQQPQFSGELSFHFERAPHKGWIVYDPQGALAFEVTYKKAGIFHSDGCDVHRGQGGPILASVLEETLTFGSYTTPLKRVSKHSQKLSFVDAQGREFSFREAGPVDFLIKYPSKENVVKANVGIRSGQGSLTVMDPANAPELPVLIAAYVDLLRRQQDDKDTRRGGQAGVIGAIAAQNS